MQYIIDILTITDQLGNTGQHWHSVHDTLGEAETEYSLLSKDRQIIAAALTYWQPSETARNDKVNLGSWSSRNCAGVPIAKLIKHGSRSYTKTGSVPDYLNPNRERYVTLDDWTDTDGMGAMLSTQPSPGFELKPTKRSADELKLMENPGAISAHGKYEINWTNSGGFKSYTVRDSKAQALDVINHEGATDYSIKQITYSDELKQFAKLVTDSLNS